jgi:O-6-methylguanine DNA methyltransferase
LARFIPGKFNPMKTACIETPDGCFVARFTERGLAGLEFPSQSPARAPSDDRLDSAQRTWLKTTERAIRAILAGQEPTGCPPLDLSGGTPFQVAVWSELRCIETGTTRSYGEIARVLKRPLAARAVGAACGANPIPLLIPCHRVLAANHRIGGFSGGLDWKRRLLEREGVTVRT